MPSVPVYESVYTMYRCIPCIGVYPANLAYYLAYRTVSVSCACMLLLVSAMLDACVAPCVCVCVYSTKCVESAVGTGFCGAFLACLTAAGQPQASRRCLTAAGQPQASRTSLLTLFSRSTEIPGPSLLTLFARSTEIPVKAGASQLGKKHPARLLGRHTLGKLGWRPSERTDAGVPELGRSI